MESLTLPDGRPVQLWLGGAGAGPVGLFFHGTPDTRWAARSGAEAARTVGVRLLCVNRPGYGLSARTDSTYSSRSYRPLSPPTSFRSLTWTSPDPHRACGAMDPINDRVRAEPGDSHAQQGHRAQRESTHIPELHRIPSPGRQRHTA